ncbi:MAG: hypothetical protein IJ193_05415, partial [Bacilli bacterium]|nr:hypothetical protein [Bacilli bacterium]
YIDSIQPKLIWDDEANSLRENYNTFMVMGFALLFFAFFCGGGYLLCLKGLHLSLLILLTIILLMLFTVFFWAISRKDIQNNIILQEEA